MENSDKRCCWNCHHHKMCKPAQAIWDAMKNVSLNVDTNDAPGKSMEVFSSLAKCCLDFLDNDRTNVSIELMKHLCEAAGNNVDAIWFNEHRGVWEIKYKSTIPDDEFETFDELWEFIINERVG